MAENAQGADKKLDELFAEVNQLNIAPDQGFSEALSEKLLAQQLTYKNHEMDQPDQASGMSSIQKLLRNKFALAGLVSVLILIPVVVVLFVLPGNVAAPTGDDSKQTTYMAELSYIEGQVQVATEGGGFIDAEETGSVQQGDVIRTYADSRAIVQLDDGSVVRLDENSEVELSSLDPNNIEIMNNDGQVYARVVKAEREFAVNTGVTKFVAQGTAYTTIKTQKLEGVKVYESSVGAYAKDVKTEDVKEGKEFYFKNSDSKKVNKLLDLDKSKVKKDEFAIWNRDEDKKTEEFADKLGYFEELDKPEEPEPEVQGEQTSKKEPVKTETPKVVSTPTYISISAYKVDTGIKVTWSVSNVNTSDGFKVVWSQSTGPIYGKDAAQYVGGSDARSAFLSLKDGKTYHIKVCAYRASSSTCDNYSNEVVVTAPSSVASVVNSISLSVVSGNKVGWSIDGSAGEGVKLLWSKSANPTYPAGAGTQAQYNSSTGSGYGYIEAFDGAGTYYVRVCNYVSATGSCGKYSNQVTVDL